METPFCSLLQDRNHSHCWRWDRPDIVQASVGRVSRPLIPVGKALQNIDYAILDEQQEPERVLKIGQARVHIIDDQSPRVVQPMDRRSYFEVSEEADAGEIPFRHGGTGNLLTQRPQNAVVPAQEESHHPALEVSQLQFR